MGARQLERDILRTVAWFSLFDAPVTAFEIWRWMRAPVEAYTLADVRAAAGALARVGRLDASDGFFSLPAGQPGRAAALLAERRARFSDAARKYARLRRAARYLRALPWIEGVAAANTLAWWNTRPDSDIDLLVVARPGSIWLARLFAVTPFALLGRRPRAASPPVPGTGNGGCRYRVPAGAPYAPLCFSFFLASDALDLSAFRLPGDDPYFAYWTASLVPVVDRDGTFERLAGQNGWAAKELPRAFFERNAASSRAAFHPGQIARFIERLARRMQLARLPARLRQIMNADTRVVVTDRALKFHDNDRREEYRDGFERLVLTMEREDYA